MFNALELCTVQINCVCMAPSYAAQPPRHGGLQKQGPALNNARIVPDLVDHVDLNDAVTLSVRYGDRIVTTGNELKPSEVRPGVGPNTSVFCIRSDGCP